MEFLDQKPTFTQVDMAALLQGTVLAHQPRARTQGIQLMIEAPDDSCLPAGDEHLLTMAIGNLIDNALRHTLRADVSP
ncbi:hypothetical protein SRB17_50120 [Streptomyces sp. RB17]|uniref:hypothetical protein n=1 Tax=Streptomyces sp. RB17 TaxID=2585197 RepID=UPI0013083AC7|nr:hypothetical protein [Streptomyces sp. RB17]MQY37010.1 hypothetical protein [Streptomyces sp. RB17]